MKLRHLVTGLCLFSALGCHSRSDDCTATDTCPASGGGAGGSGGAATGGSGGLGTGGAGGAGARACAAGESPAADDCTATEATGVFVDPTAAADGDGSREAPFASLADALDAAGGVKAVFLCATHGKLDGALTVADDGATLLGGFDCDAGWAYDEATPSLLTGGPRPLTVTADNVTLADLGVEAADATAPGTSSVALFASGAAHLTLTRVALAAGDGASGTDAVAGSAADRAYTFAAAATLAGGDATTVLQGAGCRGDTLACPAGDLPGQGGDGGRSLAAGEAGTAGQPTTLSGGQGGTVAECLAGTGAAKAGATPADSVDGAGAALLGTVTAAGWTPGPGQDGLPGLPGQGGGGGASVDATGGGGGGACGGCGGRGALGATGGGASIALLSFQSTVTLVDCSLEAADAGSGGSAAGGQSGQPGGMKGNSTGAACDGGSGAAGQAGGAAGAGAGGLSAGIVFAGTAPDADAATTDAITLGTAGTAGTAAAAHPTTGALDGSAETVLDAS